MIKRFLTGTRTLRVRILAIVALCWLLPTLVLGVYMSGLFISALQEKTEQALVAGAAHAQELTVQLIERTLKKSKDVTYDGEIWDFTAAYQAEDFRYEDFFIRCRTYWHKMFLREQRHRFTAFFLVDEPDKLVYTADHVDTLLSFRRNAQSYILSLGETLDTRSRFAYTDGNLYHVRNLYNRKLERFGMLVLELDPAHLFSAFLDEASVWQGQVDILLDEYTHIANGAYPFTLADTRRGLYAMDDDLCYSQQIKTSDYTLTYRIRLDGDIVLGQVREYSRIVSILLVLLAPLEALIMLFLHRSFGVPLARLAKAAQRLATGELGVTVSAGGNDEISRVGTAFNAMSLQIQQLIDKSYREELALRDARISALQSRINPHFLNNALELMNWQARLEGADTVSQMIESMSTLINAALDRGNERTVPLSTEVEVADAYFFFIQQRFGDRVRIEKHIDDSLRGVPVPRLSVQTLLENAVEHGINPMGGGVIRLHVYRRDAFLYIDVRNDGKPISPDAREKIDRLLSDPSRDAASSEHVGIRNINLRLKLIYHDDAGLTLTTDENGETLARIILPYEPGMRASHPAGARGDKPAQPNTTDNTKNQ